MSDPRRRRRAWIAVAGLAAALLAPCVIAAVVRSGWKADGDAALAALEADGLGTSLESLGVTGPIATDGDSELWQPYEPLPARVRFMAGTSPLQLEKALAPDASQDTLDLVYPAHSDDAPPGPPDVAGAVAMFVARVDELEPMIDRAIAEEGSFPIEWSQVAFRASRPHLMGLKDLVNGLGMRAAWRMRQGDDAAAWRDVERMLGLARRLDEPLLISRLVRVALLGISTFAIGELLQLGPPPSPVQRARLEAALLAHEDLDGYQRVLRGELTAVLAPLDGDPGALSKGLLSGEEGPSRLEAKLLVGLWRRDWIDVMGRSIRACREPSPLKRLDALEAASESARDASLVAMLLAPPYGKAFSKELEALARLRLSRAALRLTSEGIPASPGELPLDPWTEGAPLRYAREPDGTARLWSVGPDRKDDGGRARDPEEPDRAFDEVVQLGRR